ncbi:hypothetical protein ASD15_05460 [Massilia sp. Root351]|jgi:hypothetical protein|uniref:hypothetical protein n=1 Tax=Massilia sp. Root351 TaxID=1736522 RepID=UPI0007110992|nr:hypothetical protein [Massilia sp. Root351]KQV84628.1 hypothetical protein ASD15_05460 [Massilia sp. Root351]
MRIFNRLRMAALPAVALALAACSANPVNNAFTNMWDLGGGLPTVMTTKVIFATVASDEGPVSAMGRQDRALTYNQGIRYGAPEEAYRMARVDMLNHSTSFMKWATTVAVPDTFPTLKMGDVLAIRIAKTRDGLQDFAATKEGNAAVSLVCRVGSADYEQCWKKLPVAEGTSQMRGANGVTQIPYGTSLAQFGLVFSPRYDASGQLLSSAPAAPSR